MFTCRSSYVVQIVSSSQIKSHFFLHKYQTRRHVTQNGKLILWLINCMLNTVSVVIQIDHNWHENDRTKFEIWAREINLKFITPDSEFWFPVLLCSMTPTTLKKESLAVKIHIDSGIKYEWFAGRNNIPCHQITSKILIHQFSAPTIRT